jgi:hypothetical protein
MHTQSGVLGSDGSGAPNKLYLPNGKGTGKAGVDSAKTGISVTNLPAKSTVSVSIDANDAGEHLPLVYVLICQKVA